MTSSRFFVLLFLCLSISNQTSFLGKEISDMINSFKAKDSVFLQEDKLDQVLGLLMADYMFRTSIPANARVSEVVHRFKKQLNNYFDLRSAEPIKRDIKSFSIFAVEEIRRYIPITEDRFDEIESNPKYPLFTISRTEKRIYPIIKDFAAIKKLFEELVFTMIQLNLTENGIDKQIDYFERIEARPKLSWEEAALKKLLHKSIFNRIGVRWNENNYGSFLYYKVDEIQRFFKSVFDLEDYYFKKVDELVEFTEAINKKLAEISDNQGREECLVAFPGLREGFGKLNKIKAQIEKYIQDLKYDDQEHDSVETRRNMNKYLLIKAINKLR